MRCTAAIENRCAKTLCDWHGNKKKQKMFMFFIRIMVGFKANNVLLFLLLFTYWASLRHLSIIDNVKCLLNELSWLRKDRLLELSINCPTSSYKVVSSLLLGIEISVLARI